MLKEKDILLDFYNDNPQLFFIKESNNAGEYEALSPSESGDYAYQNSPDTEPEGERVFSKEELEGMNPPGKNSSFLIKLGLAATTLAISANMMADVWKMDKTSDNSHYETNPKVISVVQKSPNFPEKENKIKDVVLNNPEFSEDEVSLVEKLPSVSYDTELDKNKTKQKIKKHEGYEKYPYPDVKQWSVGHGTGLKDFTKKEIRDLKPERLRRSWDKLKSDHQKMLFAKQHYPGWFNDFKTKYGINTKENENTGVGKTSANKASEIVFKKNIAKMKYSNFKFSNDDIFKYWELAPDHVKQVYIDLSYNMGSGFLRVFNQFNTSMAYALANLDKDLVTPHDVELAEMGIASAADELIWNYNKDGTKRGLTLYFIQNKKRAMKNYKILKTTPVNIISEGHRTKSLKSIYSFLFS